MAKNVMGGDGADGGEFMKESSGRSWDGDVFCDGREISGRGEGNLPVSIG